MVFWFSGYSVFRYSVFRYSVFGISVFESRRDSILVAKMDRLSPRVGSTFNVECDHSRHATHESKSFVLKLTRAVAPAKSCVRIYTMPPRRRETIIAVLPRGNAYGIQMQTFNTVGSGFNSHGIQMQQSI